MHNHINLTKQMIVWHHCWGDLTGAFMLHVKMKDVWDVVLVDRTIKFSEFTSLIRQHTILLIGEHWSKHVGPETLIAADYILDLLIGTFVSESYCWKKAYCIRKWYMLLNQLNAPLNIIFTNNVTRPIGHQYVCIVKLYYYAFSNW